MKVTATQYAKSLYELTDGKSEQNIDGVIAGLVKILGKNRQIKLLPKIIAKFSEIYNREKGIIEAEITTRVKIDEIENEKIKNFVKQKYQAGEVILKNIVDEKIKGGIVIKVGDEILDGSITSQLNNLKNILTK